jgi:hypothetical protein
MTENDTMNKGVMNAGPAIEPARNVVGKSRAFCRRTDNSNWACSLKAPQATFSPSTQRNSACSLKAPQATFSPSTRELV